MSRGNISKAIRAARQFSGLSQEKFGEAASRAYVSSLERGQQAPSFHKVEDLAGAMGIEPGALFLLA